jgi:hypothetical protein
VILPHSCVILVFIAVSWQQTRWGHATRCATRLGTEKTPLRLLLHNRGSVFRCYSFCMAQIRNTIIIYFHISISKYYQYSQNRHDILSKRLLVRSSPTTQLTFMQCGSNRQFVVVMT